jgi:hypothetical protein
MRILKNIHRGAWFFHDFHSLDHDTALRPSLGPFSFVGEGCRKPPNWAALVPRGALPGIVDDTRNGDVELLG